MATHLAGPAARIHRIPADDQSVPREWRTKSPGLRCNLATRQRLFEFAQASIGDVRSREPHRFTLLEGIQEFQSSVCDLRVGEVKKSQVCETRQVFQTGICDSCIGEMQLYKTGQALKMFERRVGDRRMIEFQLCETGQSLEVFQVGIGDLCSSEVHRIDTAHTEPDDSRTNTIKRGNGFLFGISLFLAQIRLSSESKCLFQMARWQETVNGATAQYRWDIIKCLRKIPKFRCR